MFSAAELSKASNKNLVSAYAWAAGLLDSIVRNDPFPVSDLATGRSGAPMFVVLGACPNAFCGMQAVMFSRMAGDAARHPVDFWWVKPTVTHRYLPLPTVDFWWVKPRKHV